MFHIAIRIIITITSQNAFYRTLHGKMFSNNSRLGKDDKNPTPLWWGSVTSDRRMWQHVTHDISDEKWCKITRLIESRQTFWEFQSQAIGAINGNPANESREPLSEAVHTAELGLCLGILKREDQSRFYVTSRRLVIRRWHCRERISLGHKGYPCIICTILKSWPILLVLIVL